MDLHTRIFASLSANTFGQFVNIGGQILLVPIFLHAWTSEYYGEWLVLSALAAYFSAMDFGFGLAAVNEITVAGVHDDRTKARVVMCTANTLQAAISSVILAGLLAGWMLDLDARNALGVHTISQAQCYGVLLAQAVYALSGMHSTIFSATYRFAMQNARGVMYSNVARIAEIVVVSTLLAAKAEMLSVAIGMALVRVFFVTGVIIDACRRFGISTLSLDIHLSCARRLVKPGWGFVLILFGNISLVQGPVLVVNHLLGGSAVTVLSTTRTLLRIMTQSSNVIGNSIWPEVSRLIASGQLAVAGQVRRSALQLSIVINLTMGFFLLIAAPWIIRIWSGKVVNIDRLFIAVYTLQTMLGSIWFINSFVLAAGNTHARFAARFCALSIVSIPLMGFAVANIGLYGVPLVYLAMDLVLLKLIAKDLAESLPNENVSLFGDIRQIFFGGSFWRALRKTPLLHRNA